MESGQLLASLETETSNADMRRAEINLDVAKLNRELFIMQAKDFSEEYSIYLKMRGYDVEVALALDEVNARADTAQVKAPFKGTLLSVFITPDRSVEAFKSVMVLADVTRLEVSADLTSTDLQELQEGLPVKVAAVSGPATQLAGKIRKLPYPYGKASGTTHQDETQDTSTRVSLNEIPATATLSLGDLVRVQVMLEKRASALWRRRRRSASSKAGVLWSCRTATRSAG